MSDDEEASDPGEGSEAFESFLRGVARSESREPPSKDELIGSTLAHYGVVAELGRGGMGVVYRAEDSRLARTVALKVLPASIASNEERRRRFFREARAAAAVNHPNIATVYEVGEADGRLFLAMERVEGATLRARLAEGPLGQTEALRVARQIATGLSRAHEKGIVHRDLKPENVMLTRDGDVKILDFGLAKLREPDSTDTGPGAETTLTQEGRVMGTPGYMSPEQATGRFIDQRTDVYALGVLLHEMSTGEQPGALGSGRVAADPHVAAIVSRCLARAPEDRWKDAGEMLGALDALAGKLQKRGRRWPARWMVAVVVVIAAVALTVGFASKHRASLAPSRTYVERRPSINGENVFDVLLSSDAQTIAYVAEAGGKTDAYTQSVGTGLRTRIPLPPAMIDGHYREVCGFFPDGGLLLRVTQAGAPELVEDSSALWKVGPAAGSFQLVAPPGRASRSVRLAPDGKHLLVMREGNLYTELLAGGESVHIARSVEPGAVWSPKGDMIAYGTFDATGAGSINVVSSDGKRTQQLLSDVWVASPVGSAALGWSDPHELVAVLRRGGGSVLVELSLDDQGRSTGAPRDLYVWSDTQVSDLSMANGVVAFAKMTAQNAIFTAPLAPDAGRPNAPLVPLTADEGEDYPAGWLDDARLAFESSREGFFGLYARARADGPVDLVSRDLRVARVEATGEVLGWKRTASDAGERCALTRLETGGARQLFTVSGNDAASVTCYAELRCVRSGSDRRCIALEASSAGFVWSPVDVETGRKGARLYSTSQPVRAWDLSPAGDTFGFTIDNLGAVINYVAIPSGVLRQVRVTPEFGVQFIVYTPDGQHLLLTGMNWPDGSRYVLATSDLEGHAHVVATSADVWFNTPSVSPSGQQVAVGEMTFRSRLWLLEPR